MVYLLFIIQDVASLSEPGVFQNPDFPYGTCHIYSFYLNTLGPPDNK